MLWSRQPNRSSASAHPAQAAYLWRRLGRMVRGGCVGLTLMASLELTDPANAQIPERWRAHPSVGLLEGVTLRIHWFSSTEELREAAKNSGQKINEIGLKGFSILKRNTKTGEYTCDLYVVNMTGAQIDADRTMTFGHEVLHCVGLQHE